MTKELKLTREEYLEKKIKDLETKINNYRNHIKNMESLRSKHIGQISSFGTAYAELEKLRRITADISEDDLRMRNERLLERNNRLSDQLLRIKKDKEK